MQKHASTNANRHSVVVVVVVVTQPFPRNGVMAEDHGAPEAGQLPRESVVRYIRHYLLETNTL